MTINTSQALTQESSHLSTDAYKGVRDFFPEDQAMHSYIRDTQKKVVELFGFEEYHASVLEPSELYKSKGAENEEIISEQSYTFTDRGGREVTLRPEMTPTVARMVAARKRELGYPLRLYAIPNLFRYERPQRGRLREHWQLNVDIFGSESRCADAEVIFVAHTILKSFGASENEFEVLVGSRTFLDTLVKTHDLDEAGAKALRSHLDRRAKMPHSEFKQGLEALGIQLDALDTPTVPPDVEEVISILIKLGVTNVRFAPEIVRGFNYYTGVVFELFDLHPENNRAIMGGGRYDNLLSLFSNERVSAVGFGMGDVSLQNFLSVRKLIPTYVPKAQLYVAVQSQAELMHAMALTQRLRDTGLRVALDFAERKISDQMRMAAKHKISHVLIVGENEIREGLYQLKNIQDGSQTLVNESNIASEITKINTL